MCLHLNVLETVCNKKSGPSNLLKKKVFYNCILLTLLLVRLWVCAYICVYTRVLTLILSQFWCQHHGRCDTVQQHAWTNVTGVVRHDTPYMCPHITFNCDTPYIRLSRIYLQHSVYTTKHNIATRGGGAGQVALWRSVRSPVPNALCWAP